MENLEGAVAVATSATTSAGVLVKLDFHSKYFCLHSARLFFNPKCGDILVSFLVYME